MWKKNHYDKIEKKQQPLIYFATDNKVLIAADSIANLYAVDYANRNLLWKTFNTASFNSETIIFEDKVFTSIESAKKEAQRIKKERGESAPRRCT